MVQSVAPLLGPGYMPLAQGIAPDARTGFEGLPFVGQVPGGALMAMAAMPALQGMMGQVGMIPLGVGTDQNLYDTIRAMQFQRMQTMAMQSAAQADRASFMHTMQGAAALAGVPFGAEQRRLAGTWADAAVAASPILAQLAPDVLDQLAGSRGSATVLASRMGLAGRYRIDPVTGRMGMSAESVGAATRRLFDDLYSDPSIAHMQGITAGQLGGLYGELQKRGLLQAADPAGLARRAATALAGSGELAAIASRQGVDLAKGPGGLSGADLDRLALDNTFADRMRGFDTARVKQSLASYTKAVAAMRDIFGDMGQPNAPMQALIAGLDRLTAGAANQIDPGRLSMMVRQTYNLATQTGMTMDAAMMLQEHAANRGAMLGLEPLFAARAAQGAMGFGGAYRALGQGAAPAWGLMTADQMQQLDANLRMQGAASPAANRIAAAMRIRDTLGGFQAGSDAHAFTQAVAQGLDQFRDAGGRLRSVNMAEGEFLRMLAGARGARGEDLRLTENDVRNLVNQRDTNREYAEKYQAMDLVRRRQGADEVIPYLGQTTQVTLRARLRSIGVEEDAARRIARDLGGQVTAQAFGLDAETFRDTQLRNRAIAGQLEQGLAGTEAGAALAALSPRERAAFLTGTAEQAFGGWNRAIATSQFRGLRNAVTAQAAFDRTTLNAGDQQQIQANQDAAIQEALAPLGQGTALRRAVDAIQRTRPGGERDIQRILAEAIGGVSRDEIAKALAGPAARMNEQLRAVESLTGKLRGSTDPGERADLERQLEGARRALAGGAAELAGMGERQGLAVKGVGASDLNRAADSARAVLRTQADLVAVRAGGGDVVSDAEAAAVVGRRGAASEADAMAVLLFRRKDEVRRLRASAELQRTDPRIQAMVEEIGREKKGISLDDARKEALDRLDAAATDFTDAASQQTLDAMAADLRVESPEEARALIRARRRRTPGTVSPEEIAAIRSEHSGLGRKPVTEAQAEDIAAARHRAARLGITPEAIKAQIGTPRGGADWTDEIAAIDALLEQRERAEYEVSATDIAEFQRRAPVTQAQRDVLAKETRFRGAPIGALDQEIAIRGIQKERSEKRRARFDAFWKSDGVQFRSDVTQADADVGDVAARLIASKEMTRRLGTRAFDLHEELSGGRQRLRDLAAEHAGGDLARLMAGDLDSGTANPRAVIEEVFGIQARQREAQREIRDTERPWRSAADEAAHLLGVRTGETLSDARRKELATLTKDVEVARRMTAEQEAAVRGGDAKAIAGAAKAIGTDEAGARRAVAALDRLDRIQDAMHRDATEAGDSVAARLLDAYGLGHPDGQVTRQQRRLGETIERAGGRELARRILTTRSDLERIATAGGGKGQGAIDTMVAAYDAAAGARDEASRRRELAAFRSKYGLGGKENDARWHATENAIRFQKQTGFLGRKLDTDADVLQLFERAATSKLVPRTPAGGDGSGTVSMHGKIDGTLRIIGDQGNVVADVGGTRHAAVSS